MKMVRVYLREHGGIRLSGIRPRKTHVTCITYRWNLKKKFSSWKQSRKVVAQGLVGEETREGLGKRFTLSAVR